MVFALVSCLFAGVTLTLPGEVRVRGAEIALGDVLHIDGDQGDAERAAAIPLGYAPAPGFSRILNRDFLTQLIRARAPELEFAFEGALACRVTPETEEIPGQALMAAVQEKLAKRLAGQDARLVARQTVAALQVPLGRRPYELHVETPVAELKPGEVTAAVRVMVDDQIYRSVWTSWNLEIWRTLPVLRQDVKRGEIIESSALEDRRVQVPEGGSGELLYAEKIAGNQAARDLRAGEPLRSGDIVRPALVRIGDALHLQVRRGSVVVKIAATARQDGARGDRIRVAVDGSQREMTGQVLSREMVEINLDTR